MTNAERRKLFGYHRALNGVERNLRDTTARGVHAVDAEVGNAIADEIDRLEKDFPDLGPPSRVRDLRERGDRPYYVVESLLAKLSLVLGRISAALEEDASTPVTDAWRPRKTAWVVA